MSETPEPAPKGAGIVAAGTPKKILKMAGLDDVYTCSRGHTRSMGNFVTATFLAIKNTYHYLTPDLWSETHYRKAPNQEFTDFLAKPQSMDAPKLPDGPPAY